MKPSRYVGSEFNAIRKDSTAVDLRMVISYPDAYEVGMSNLGIRILYECVNREERLACERVFAPWPDFEKVLREQHIPLYSLETFTPLSAFDVLGFSIGVGQWLLLRRRLPRAGWWIGANVVGWVLLGLITGDPLHQFDLLALGFLPTCVTAVMIGLLMNQAQPTEPRGA